MLKEKLSVMSDKELIELQNELYNSKGIYTEDSNVRNLIKECFPNDTLFTLHIIDVIVALLPEITIRFKTYSNYILHNKI